MQQKYFKCVANTGKADLTSGIWLTFWETSLNSDLSQMVLKTFDGLVLNDMSFIKIKLFLAKLSICYYRYLWDTLYVQINLWNGECSHLAIRRLWKSATVIAWPFKRSHRLLGVPSHTYHFHESATSKCPSDLKYIIFERIFFRQSSQSKHQKHWKSEPLLAQVHVFSKY